MLRPTEQLRKYLLEQMRIIVGLPSQDAGGISGGDTGDAGLSSQRI